MIDLSRYVQFFDSIFGKYPRRAIPRKPKPPAEPPPPTPTPVPPVIIVTPPPPTPPPPPPPPPPVLPPPVEVGRIPITTAQVPQTVIDTDPNGMYLVKAGTHVNRTFVFNGSGYNGLDILCEPGVIFEGGGSAGNRCFMQGTASNVTFRGWDATNMVKVNNYVQSGSQTTALVMGGSSTSGSESLTGSHWVVSYVHMDHCGRVSMRPGNSCYTGYNRISHAVELGMGGGGFSTQADPGIIEHNTVEYSNTANADPGFEGGESKFVSDWMILRYNTFQGWPTHAVASNASDHTHEGYGLWLDVFAANYTVHDNIIRDIYRGGLIVEISGRGNIYNNTIERCGFKWAANYENSWGFSFGSGIQICASGTGPDTIGSIIDIYNNTITDCYEGWSGLQQRRGRYQVSPTIGSSASYEHILTQMKVHNNTLTRCGNSGWMDDVPSWNSGTAYKHVNRDNDGHTEGNDPERNSAHAVLFNNRYFRCIVDHTNQSPPSTATDNTYWHYQGERINVVSSGNQCYNNTYVNCGASGSIAAQTGSTNHFYSSPLNLSWAAWQASGQDAGSTFTGSPPGTTPPPVTSPPPPAGNLRLPAPDASGRTNITTSDNPSTLIAANPSGRFLLKAGVHNGRQFNFVGNNADVLCEPGAILDGGNAAISAIYGVGNGITFRGWDDTHRVEIRNYKQTGNDTTAVNMGPLNADSWSLRTGWTMGYLWIHDCGVVNIRPGNQSYLGYSLSETGYGLCVGGGGLSTATNPSIIEHCTFRYGNTSNIDPGNQGGNSKFVSDWMIVRNCTFSGYRTHAVASTTPGTTHDDYGLWLDVDCTNYDIHDNTIQDIYRAGLIIEISGRGSIYNNTIQRVGFRQAQAFLAAWGSTFAAGIQISASGTGPNSASTIDIHNNNLIDCYEGINGYWAPRGHWQRFTAEHALQNMNVHSNTLTRCGPSGILMDGTTTAWASGQSYVVGANTAEHYDGSHRLRNGRVYRCILNHTSATGVNEPSGTSANNTWWNHQGLSALNRSSGCDFQSNTYVDCGFPTGETAARAATIAPFYYTGSGPNFAAWQALGYDTGGSFTGTPGYISS